jgi:glycosyltransferase involved in cell wall biosynthesis
MQRARAFVFAAEEDFGIMPVEAQACGTPVICYGRGGATESVVSGKTGVFFEHQTAESIEEAVGVFEADAKRFRSDEIRANAERFGREIFTRRFSELVEDEYRRHLSRRSVTVTARDRVTTYS